MEKKTIGGFIAVLRKANGMTQQEVADKLNISNKAVSRWERDECAPDISLIPAIAELFEVTCDELLKGERIFTESNQEKNEQKVEKQLKSLINRAISNFKTLIWISLALSVVGYVCMLGISYGFLRPVIGFFVMLLFEASSVVCAVIAINKMKEAKSDNELFDFAEPSLINKFNNALGEFSYAVFFVSLCAILLSMPLAFVKPSFVYSVLNFELYLLYFVPPVALMLFVIYTFTKRRYSAFITEQKYIKSMDNNVITMNFLQLGAVLVAGALFIIAPFYVTHLEKTSVIYVSLIALAFVLLIFCIVCFFVFISKYKSNRDRLILSGVRNLIMIPICIMLIGVHEYGFGWSSGSNIDTNGNIVYEKTDFWNMEYFWASAALAIAVFVIFKIFSIIKKKQ